MDKSYHERYFELERKNWWFKARLKIIELLLQEKVLVNFRDQVKILNAGAATGTTSKMLEKYGEIDSVEIDKECCTLLNRKLGLNVIQASLTDMPFEDNSFEIVCAFDVIEHIDEDQKAMIEIHRVLKEGGVAFLTAPAYGFLWSEHDEVNHHYRRYTASQLTALAESHQLKCIYKSYINFILFLPAAIYRLISILFRGPSSKKEFKSDFERLERFSPLNGLFYRLFKAEVWFLKMGVRFPFGLSALTIVKKGA